MTVQVAAHGFELTDGLRTACEAESQDKLQLLALNNFSSKWVLSIEKTEHVAHLAWTDGGFRGDVTVRSEDMYKSISQCSKKAVEQIKKAHDKRNDHKKSPTKALAVEAVSQSRGAPAGDVDDFDVDENY
jgi:ribosome-associated translation inhibitor RaiA